MLNLSNILKEALKTPTAIFLAGPAGSGKTYVSQKLLPINKFQVLNVDVTYEKLLNATGLGTNIKDFSSEKLSQAAKLMAQARKETDTMYRHHVENANDIIIDGTGGSSGPLLKKKQELESLGYKTFMIALYVSPVTSLERNVNRDRALLPQVIMRTWRDYSKNIDIYRSAFKQNFVLINNDPVETPNSFDEASIKKKYYDTAKFTAKPKTDKEIKKAEDEHRQMMKDVEFLLSINREFDDLAAAKAKLRNFLK